MDRLKEAEDLLTSLYWDMVDNHENKRECRRLDTILGKIRDLREMMEAQNGI